jgi:energy-coupling factor transporter ATP-binding protein EcfA2|nr:ATP-binding cassette domain-containing protein [uncultured Acetatifactor sp.]
MRRKRNRLNKTLETEGYIKKYFGQEIGRILLPNTRNLQNCEIPYVCHEEAERTLADCLIGDFYKDKSIVFTGLTGSGKTTILRHVFGLEENANKSIIKENTIIISVDFNRSQSSAQDAILSSLRAAVQKIVDTYKIDYPNTVNEKFYEYIDKRRSDFLWLDSKHNQDTPHKERMEVLLDKMPTAFASCQLQYAMDQNECGLQLVVLIVDNIEAFMDSILLNDFTCHETSLHNADWFNHMIAIGSIQRYAV